MTSLPVSASLGVALNPGLAGVAGVPGVGLISMVAGQPPGAGEPAAVRGAAIWCAW